MDFNKILEKYEEWLRKAGQNQEIISELQELAGDKNKIEDAFYQNLSFGTGGLRGIIGAGTNRMNVFTVAKASQGLSDYINRHSSGNSEKIAISYDSRIKSELFAQTAAGVFSANGLEVFLFPELMPTPCLSFAVRRLKCTAGVMITASHNPYQYNGYKVYGADGCQITTDAAESILFEINKLDIFADIHQIEFEEGIANGTIRYIPEHVYIEYIEEVKKQQLSNQEKMDKNVSIIYTPLNGTGLKPVCRTLKEAGYTNIVVVSEQARPDSFFTTCPYPNPEIKETLTLGLEYAKRYKADLLLATDPDCDRVGAAVKHANGNYILLSGNETGILLLDYICSRRLKSGSMPKEPLIIKSIVTTDMAERIAAYYQVGTVNVLTGFKFIGEQIGRLDSLGKEASFIFGLEESGGYLSGTYVRDKDGVSGALLICEMFCYYKSQNISLLERLEQLYSQFGFSLNTLHSFEFEGSNGLISRNLVMERLRKAGSILGGIQVKSLLDYAKGLEHLPKADVLKFILEDNSSLVVRPSGTEPKLKVYISVNADNRESAVLIENRILKSLKEYLK